MKFKISAVNLSWCSQTFCCFHLTKAQSPAVSCLAHRNDSFIYFQQRQTKK